MPIVIPRTGEMPPPVSGFSQEARNNAWAYLVKVYIDKHPEVLSAAAQPSQTESALTPQRLA